MMALEVIPPPRASRRPSASTSPDRKAPLRLVASAPGGVGQSTENSEEAKNSEENAYERALSRELTVYEDGATAWRFQLLLAGAPLGVLFGAERATLFSEAPGDLYRMGVTALVIGLVLASAGYLAVINAKQSLSARLARCMIVNGQVTLPVARAILRMRLFHKAPLAILSVGFYVAILAGVLMLLAEANLLYPGVAQAKIASFAANIQ